MIHTEPNGSITIRCHTDSHGRTWFVTRDGYTDFTLYYTAGKLCTVVYDGGAMSAETERLIDDLGRAGHVLSHFAATVAQRRADLRCSRAQG